MLFIRGGCNSSRRVNFPGHVPETEAEYEQGKETHCDALLPLNPVDVLRITYTPHLI